MTKKKNIKKGGGLWDWWTNKNPVSTETDKEKKNWWDNLKGFWGDKKNEVQPKQNLGENIPTPAPAPVQQPPPQTLNSSISGGKKRKKRKTIRKKRGGNYKTVHHSNMAKPTYWLN
uniref:Uncharacterized protein n=1 Tax=viral metagenome TaxID=1070528 RepID=A0A6C0H5L6_9ZZZZ